MKSSTTAAREPDEFYAELQKDIADATCANSSARRSPA